MMKKLEKRIKARASAPRDESWTAQLLSKGTERCAKKFGEEAFELVIAALQEDKSALIEESADLLYHFLVLLRARDVSLEEIEAVLKAREAQSGLAEKRARKGDF